MSSILYTAQEQRIIQAVTYDLDAAAWMQTPAGVAKRLARYSPEIREWRSAPHLRVLSSAANDAIDGTGPTLMIVNLPPQHGKSTLLSWATPITALIKHPDWNVVMLSHEARYAASWGGRVRDTIAAAADILPAHMRLANSTARDEWTIAGGGGMKTSGLGGSVTGRRANLLLVDDPVAGAVQVQSKTYRDQVWEFIRANGITRLAPGAVVIIVATRWHDDDPPGRIQREEDRNPDYPRWHHINMPAIADAPNDSIGRKPGEALWPSRYPLPWLRTQRALVGPDAWSAQYMGRPGSPSGAIWKRWFWYGRNRYDPTNPPPIVATILSVDTNAKEGSGNARTAIVVGQLTARPYRLLVRYGWARNLGFTNIPTAILTVAKAYRHQHLKRIIIEDEVTGSAAIDTLKGGTEKWVRKMIVGKRPHGPKEYRAKQAAVWGMNGSMLLPSTDDTLTIAGGPGWLHEYEEELYAAPVGEYMDFVDATSQLIDYVKRYLAVGLKERIQAGEDPALWLPGDLEEEDGSPGSGSLWLPAPFASASAEDLEDL